MQRMKSGFWRDSDPLFARLRGACKSQTALNAGYQRTHQASPPMAAISATALTTATVVATESYEKLKIRVLATASCVLPIMHKTQTKELLRSRLRCQAHTSMFRRSHQRKATS